MTIKVGDRVPAATFKVLGADGLSDVTTDDLCAGKTVALFSVPGAYTPTCTAKHVPSFLANADKLKAKGVDAIACVAVNDAFVMKAWAESMNVGEAIAMLGDGNNEFTAATGLTLDGSGAGLGQRGARFSMLIKDGVVRALHIEEAPGEMAVSDAETLLEDL